MVVRGDEYHCPATASIRSPAGFVPTVPYTLTRSECRQRILAIPKCRTRTRQTLPLRRRTLASCATENTLGQKPGAGCTASLSVFSSWAIGASAGLDVVAVELDGRGSLMDEAIPRDDNEDQRQLENILRAIEADVAGLPFVLCGFSMGALIASELTSMFSSRSSKPVGLILVGRVPPTFKPEGAAPPVETYILANETVQASEGWQTIFLPMLLADLAMDSRLALRVAKAMAPEVRGVNLRLEVHCALDDPSFPFQSGLVASHHIFASPTSSALVLLGYDSSASRI
jgi:hypothetical protein